MINRNTRAKFVLIVNMILIFSLVILMAGCGTGNESSNEQVPTDRQDLPAGEVADDSEPDTGRPFTLWVSRAWASTDDNLIQQEWAKMGFNVRIQWTQGDIMSALNLKLNSGTFEDAALFNNVETYKSAFIKSGLIMPVEELLQKPEYPSLGAIPEKILDRVKTPDGHIWLVPTWFDQTPEDPWPGWASSAWWIRTDVLEMVGMEESDLSTLEGVEKYLREVGKLKTPEGKSMIPMGFYENGAVDILSAFGVNTAVAGGAATSVKKSGDQFVFTVDDPGYKAAYQWMSQMYREGLIDKEVVTQKAELFKQKMTQGLYGMSSGVMDAKMWEPLDGPTSPAWYLKPIPNPEVEGVDEVGTVAFVDPYAAFGVFINKKTESLDSILAFLNYSLEPNPIRQHEITEGPVGKYWDWVDEPMGSWKFEEEYGIERNSGDSARTAKLSPMLWQASSYSKEWYPWWTVAPASDVKKGFSKTYEFSELIGTYGSKKAIHAHDIVPVKNGGLWGKYGLTLETVRKEYEAKLLMAKNDEEFESIWDIYMQQLEQRAHWPELKAEWMGSYQELIETQGDF